MTRPQRYRLDRRNKLPPNTRSVARPHKYGNPFSVDDFGREAALMLYLTWLTDHPDGQAIAADARRELRGKNLACFCSLDQRCHADILLRIANEVDSAEVDRESG